MPSVPTDIQSPVGPLTKIQMGRLGMDWKQGEHVLVSGGTGSGKTRLARELIDQRLKRGGHVMVMFGKLQPDETIRDYYSDFTRWTRWNRRPGVMDNKILLWPKVEGLTVEEAAQEMHEVFKDALREIGRTGNWTVVIDDGLFITSSAFLALGQTVALLHMLIRSAKGTLLTLVQRPAHIPVTIYPNITYAFVGRASESNDVKRLAELGGRQGARSLANQIAQNGTHDFTWITVGKNKHVEQLNLMR